MLISIIKSELEKGLCFTQKQSNCHKHTMSVKRPMVSSDAQCK